MINHETAWSVMKCHDQSLSQRTVFSVREWYILLGKCFTNKLALLTGISHVMCQALDHDVSKEWRSFAVSLCLFFHLGGLCDVRHSQNKDRKLSEYCFDWEKSGKIVTLGLLVHVEVNAKLQMEQCRLFTVKSKMISPPPQTWIRPWVWANDWAEGKTATEQRLFTVKQSFPFSHDPYRVYDVSLTRNQGPVLSRDVMHPNTAN